VRARLTREINYGDARAARLREEERAGKEQRISAANAEATAQRMVEWLHKAPIRTRPRAADHGFGSCAQRCGFGHPAWAGAILGPVTGFRRDPPIVFNLDDLVSLADRAA
jgi:hypothetical protein